MMQANTKAAPFKKKEWELIVLLFIGAIAVWVYSNSFFNGFVRDDGFLIEENLNIRNFSTVWEMLFHSYRPLRMVSYAIDYHFWGLNPTGYHVTNILLHVLCCYWVYALTCRLTRDSRISLYTAFLFAVHPIHTDAVTYLSGRRDLLFTFFYLMAFHFFLSYRESGKSKYLPAIFGSFILSLLSKEMAASLPFLFFGYELILYFSSKHQLISRGYFADLFRSAVQVFKRRFFFYTGMLFLFLIFLFYYVIIKKSSLLITQEQIQWWGGTVLNNFLTVSYVLIYYIKKLFFPIVLIADNTGFPVVKSIFEIKAVFSIISLFMLLMLLLKWMNKKKIIAFSMALFFITLLPVMHFIPHHELLAEHYLYLPSFGFCLLLGLSFRFLEKRSKKNSQITFLIFVFIIVLLSLRTLERNKDWHNEISLYQKDLKSNPENKRAHLLLGENYLDVFLYEKAMAEFDKATEGDGIFQDAYTLKGYIYFKRGEYLSAIAEASRALEMQEKDFGHLYLGEFYLALDEKVKALTHFQKIKAGKHYLTAANYSFLIAQELWDQTKADEFADIIIRESDKLLHIVPDDEETLLNLARCYEWRLMFDSASQVYETLKKLPNTSPDIFHARIKQMLREKEDYQRSKQILKTDPEDNTGLMLMGKLHYQIGRYQDATKYVERVLSSDSGNAEAYYIMARLYEQKRDLKNAIASMIKTTALQDENAKYHYFLGHLYARKFEFDHSIREFQRAASLNMSGPAFEAEYDKARMNRDRYFSALQGDSNRIDLARVYLDYQDFERLSFLLGELENMAGESSGMLHQIGSFYEKMGHRYVADAIRIYKKILQFAPDDAGAYTRLGYVYWKEVNELPLVISYFSKSLVLDSSQKQAGEMKKVVEELTRMYEGL